MLKHAEHLPDGVDRLERFGDAGRAADEHVIDRPRLVAARERLAHSRDHCVGRRGCRCDTRDVEVSRLATQAGLERGAGRGEVRGRRRPLGISKVTFSTTWFDNTITARPS